jgi:YHS domain-containing protein
VLLERRVFNQPEVIRAVHSRYVPLKVNVADNAKMAEHFKIDKWPTDVIVTADGREVFRSVSQQDPHRFVATLHQVAAHESVGMPMHGYAATPAPPNQNTGYDATGFPVPGGEAAFAGPRNNAPRNNQQPAAPPTNPAVIENQFAGQFHESQPAERAEMAPAYGGQFQVAGTASEPASQQPPAMAGESSNTLLRQDTAPGNPQTPNATTANNTDPAAAAQQPTAGEQQEPTGQDAPAMEGFCPVTLLEQEAWIKGDPRWGAVHRGRVYLFASEQHQQSFLANYGKYAPVLSGYDPVKFIDEGAMVDGKRAHGVFFHNQVILFADEDSLQRFWKSPERYAQALREDGR